MKKIAYVIAAICMVFALALPFLQVEKAVDWKQVEACIREYGNAKTYQLGDANFLRKQYHLQQDAYDKAIVYRNVSAMEAEELAAFYVSDDTQRQQLEVKLKQRLDNKYAAFSGYGEAQCALIEKGKVFTKGEYVFLIVDGRVSDIYHSLTTLFT